MAHCLTSPCDEINPQHVYLVSLRFVCVLLIFYLKALLLLVLCFCGVAQSF